jgi:hypothetical protein
MEQKKGRSRLKSAANANKKQNEKVKSMTLQRIMQTGNLREILACNNGSSAQQGRIDLPDVVTVIKATKRLR